MVLSRMMQQMILSYVAMRILHAAKQMLVRKLAT
jgi:hypothetical protein